MAISADIPTWFLRSSLEDAFDAAKATNPVTALRTKLRALETAARQTIAQGSLASVSANGRSQTYALPGAGVITPMQTASALRTLIDDFDRVKAFLTACAKYGLDAESVEENGWPDSSSLVEVMPAPAAITDQAVFNWMMERLQAVSEVQSDYTHLRA